MNGFSGALTKWVHYYDDLLLLDRRFGQWRYYPHDLNPLGYKCPDAGTYQRIFDAITGKLQHFVQKDYWQYKYVHADYFAHEHKDLYFYYDHRKYFWNDELILKECELEERPNFNTWKLLGCNPRMMGEFIHCAVECSSKILEKHEPELLLYVNSDGSAYIGDSSMNRVSLEGVSTNTSAEGESFKITVNMGYGSFQMYFSVEESEDYPFPKSRRLYLYDIVDSPGKLSE